MKKMLRSSLVLLLTMAFVHTAFAQVDPTLSVQGILKKSNGVAVEDGNYSLTFKLYTAPTGGSAIWTENQSDVEVSSGIYSATLGVINPLNVPFNQLYYLGVTVGSTELTPRILLTSAPYALSLIGQSNKFPSAGVVKADSIVVAGGVLARGGAPGLNGANKNGYAFVGNSGDKDSGVFSTGDGKVSLYANNTEVLSVTPTLVQANTNLTVGGNLTANNLALPSGSSVSYNGLADWRLVDTDYFLGGGAEGWQSSDKTTGSAGCAWANGSVNGASPASFGTFAGNGVVITTHGEVLKKAFNLPGSFNLVKVKFRYYFIDSWDLGAGEKAWAGFATNYSGGDLAVGWSVSNSRLNSYATNDDCGGGTTLQKRSNFYGDPDFGDFWMDQEMTAVYSGNTLYVYFGSTLDETPSNERFGIGLVEIWVK